MNVDDPTSNDNTVPEDHGVTDELPEKALEVVDFFIRSCKQPVRTWQEFSEGLATCNAPTLHKILDYLDFPRKGRAQKNGDTITTIEHHLCGRA